MAIRNYELTQEQAIGIPGFYIPGSEEYAKGLTFKGRDDDRPNPTIEFSVDGIPNSRCKLTLNPRKPLVQYVDVSAPDEQIERATGSVQVALQVELN